MGRKDQQETETDHEISSFSPFPVMVCLAVCWSKDYRSFPLHLLPFQRLVTVETILKMDWKGVKEVINRYTQQTSLSYLLVCWLAVRFFTSFSFTFPFSVRNPQDINYKREEIVSCGNER